MKTVTISLGIFGSIVVAVGAVWLSLVLRGKTKVPTTPGYITVPNAVGPGRLIAFGAVLQAAAAVTAIWA